MKNLHELDHIWRPADGNLLRTPPDSIGDMETLEERDKRLEEAWAQFGDVPMNPETEKMEEPFACFPAGTEREEIWHWFDRRHSKGAAYLLYGNGAEYVVTASELMQMRLLCDECGSASCHYNHGGECRFPMVHERKPRINEGDGCIDYDYREGE